MKLLIVLPKIVLPFLIGYNTLSSGANFVPANHPHIQYFGRWDLTDPLHPKHSWPGVSIYAEFIGTSIGVRMADDGHYYNVYIEWIRENVQQVVNDERMNGKQDIYYAQFDYFEGGYVANGHPSVATHEKIAAQLIAAIQQCKVFE